MSWSTLWVLCHDCSFQSAWSPRRAAGVTSSQKLGMETTLTGPETSTSLFTKTARVLAWRAKQHPETYEIPNLYWCIFYASIFVKDGSSWNGGSMVKLKNCRQANLEVWSFGAPHFPLAVQSVVPTYLVGEKCRIPSRKNNARSWYIDWYLYIYIDSKFKCWWYMHWYKYRL